MTKPDILIFRLDGLRPEFARCNPSLRNLLGDSIFFNNCISAAPYTIPSECSIFTSLYPNVHRVDAWSKSSPNDLHKDAVSFIEILRDEGYHTALFSPNGARSSYIPHFGFNKYELKDYEIDDPINYWKATIGPKLLLVDFNEVHDDCVLNIGEFSEARCLSAANRAFDKIMKIYNSIYSGRELVVLYSDHGVRLIDELFGDQFEYVTGKYLPDATIRSTLLLKLPVGGGGKYIDRQVCSIDIGPTLLDYAGFRTNWAQGKSLRKLINKDGGVARDSSFAYSLTGGMASSPFRPNTWSVRDGVWKLVVIRANGQESIKLYNLAEDSSELTDVILQYPEVTRKLKQNIDFFINDKSRPSDIYRLRDFDHRYYINKRPFEPIKIAKMKFRNIYEVYWRCRSNVVLYFLPSSIRSLSRHKFLVRMKRFLLN